MSEIITAVYENGILRPLQPLNLHERQTVRIQLLSEEPADLVEAENELIRIIQSLVQAGKLAPSPGCSDVEPMSKEERRELADALGQIPGKPLSEIIIKERGEV